MVERADILISVDERHAANMLGGQKTVELRRRVIRVASGSRVWIYSKVPRGYVEALGIVDEVVADAPCRIWRDYGDQTAISRHEFETYFNGLDIGYAIVFKRVHRLKRILSLEDIRKQVSSFQPPQFFKRLTMKNPELAFFQSALA